MKNRYFSTGFTLAELLAVVIIVAILSAFSLGYYKRSVEQSRFAEGLTASSALVEALNRAYFNDRLDGVADATAKKKRKIATLDISIGNPGTCSSNAKYCISTPRFEIHVLESSGVAYVRAYRGEKSNNNYTYFIDLKPSFWSTDSYKDRISCGWYSSGAKAADRKAFCQSMGYTSCSGSTCTKPTPAS